MNKLFDEFKILFKEFGPNEDLINMYLVFMGVRSACLIQDTNLFYIMPQKANLEIYFGRYPGYTKTRFDYPLVCLKKSLISDHIQKLNNEFTEEELGLYLGFECYDHDWKNLRINRYELIYILDTGKEKVPFYEEVCTSQPDLGMLARIKLRAKNMTSALKIINPKYNVKHYIDFVPKFPLKNKMKS